MNEPKTFPEYYQYYLTLHTNVWCRRLHVIGQIVTLWLLYFIISSGGWYWLLLPLVPFVVYCFAWPGHFFFEHNKPAAFTNPLWAKASDWVMLYEIIIGKQTI